MSTPLSSQRGFSLVEAVMVLVVIAGAFLAYGFLFGNISQHALKADLTVLATKLAKEKMEEIVHMKADQGYAAVIAEAPEQVANGDWEFTRSVAVTYMNPAHMNPTPVDLGYKRVTVTVSWGPGGGEAIYLATLVTDMNPSEVSGPSYPRCP